MSPVCPECKRKHPFVRDGEVSSLSMGRNPGDECGARIEKRSPSTSWTRRYDVRTVVCRGNVKLTRKEEPIWQEIVVERKLKKIKTDRKTAKQKRDEARSTKRSRRNSKGQRKKKRRRRR